MLEYLPLFVVLVASLLALAVWVPRWRMLRTVGRRAPDLSDVTCACAEAIDEGLYYFFSPSCGHCKPVSQALDRLAARGTRVVRVDVSQVCDVPRRFGVREVPAVIAIENGHIARVLVGPQLTRVLAPRDASRPAQA
jgi:thiol-disulfide isomerase/thioredoxin